MDLNRFKQLLESTMGNVKPLISENNETPRLRQKKENLNIKGILQEELKSGVYTTEKDQKIFFGKSTYLHDFNTRFQGKSDDEVVLLPKGTKFYRSIGGAHTIQFVDDIYFTCTKVGTVKFDNGGTGNKHFKYNNKTYWADALQKKLIEVFCSSSSSSNLGCLKGNCENGYGEYNLKGGPVYKGQFKNKKYDGYGVLTVTSDNFSVFGSGYYKGIYSGNWVDGSLNGTGKITTLNGDLRYYGNFEDSTLYGKGNYTYGDGSYWSGTFNTNLATDQTYYKNPKGCYFKSKGMEIFKFSEIKPRVDKIPCTPGQTIDLEKQKGNNNSVSNQVGQASCSKMNDCKNKSGTTTKYIKCDSCPEIGRLQACLRDENGNALKADNAWGKNTEAALNKLGYNGTDGVSSEDITKICDNLLANQTKFNPGDFGDGSDENFPEPKRI